MDRNQIFINKSNKVHDNKYSYNNSIYTGNRIDVTITCKDHGDFSQKPHNHLSGKGCPRCSGNKKLDKHYFLNMCSSVHEKKYDYSFVDFIDSSTLVKIKCPIHGIFEQLPKKHISGSGCQKCGKSQKLTNEEFIERSNLMHKNKYDYSSTHYINNKLKVSIVCPDHGKFLQYPGNHIKGIGCMNCGGKKKLTSEEFIDRSTLIHKNRYDYSTTVYTNSKSRVNIICPTHGIFSQIAGTHLHGRGCSKCFLPKMESYISDFLKKNKFNYVRQHSFFNLKDKGLLKFDFAIFDKNGSLNFLLEYNGEQHYNYRGQFGMSKMDFDDIKYRDILKKEYCIQNKINLIIIKFDDKVDEKLNELLII